MRYKYDMRFGMLQVRENEISLRKWSDGTAQLRTLEGTLDWWVTLGMRALCLCTLELKKK